MVRYLILKNVLTNYFIVCLSAVTKIVSMRMNYSFPLHLKIISAYFEMKAKVVFTTGLDCCSL